MVVKQRETGRMIKETEMYHACESCLKPIKLHRYNDKVGKFAPDDYVFYNGLEYCLECAKKIIHENTMELSKYGPKDVTETPF
jgi:hypothetical protein